MVSSTDGWIVGADGIYHWQEEGSSYPADYVTVAVAAVLIATIIAAGALVYFKKRAVLKKAP
jgi:hypothetical protein